MSRRRIAGITAFAVVVLGWFVLLRPGSLGGHTNYIVVSGTSMEPTFQQGDLVLMRKSDVYAPGDIVTYFVPEGEVGAGVRVVHRITGGDALSGYVLRGDNNTEEDIWRPKHQDVVGELWLRIPKAGTILNVFLRTPLSFGIIAAAIAFWVVFGAGGSTSRQKDAAPLGSTPA